MASSPLCRSFPTVAAVGVRISRHAVVVAVAAVVVDGSAVAGELLEQVHPRLHHHPGTRGGGETGRRAVLRLLVLFWKVIIIVVVVVG